MVNFTDLKISLTTLKELRNLTMQIGENNLKVFPEDDIRFYFPNQINRILIFNNLNLDYFHRVVCNKNELDLILQTPTNQDFFEVQDSYLNNLRLSLVTGLAVVIERFCRKILEAIEKKENYKESIYKIRERLFAIIEIDRSEMWNAQLILFNVRNTMHNNSIFTQKGEKHEITIDYAEKLHRFKFATVHNSGDFKTLSFIIKDLLNFYIKIINAEQVKNIENIKEIFCYDINHID